MRWNRKPNAKRAAPGYSPHKAGHVRLPSRPGGEYETLRRSVQVSAQTYNIPDEQQATARPSFNRANRHPCGLSRLRHRVRLRLEQDVHPTTGETRMRSLRSAVSQGHYASYKAKRYATRKKEGLCVDCGKPAALLDEHVASIIMRCGQLFVERGRRATRCSPCQERTRASTSGPRQKQNYDSHG